jgi:hypothetical protein
VSKPSAAIVITDGIRAPGGADIVRVYDENAPQRWPH